MVEFHIKVNPVQRVAYIPKEIYEVFGSNLRMVANYYAAIIFRYDANLLDVIKSLELILADLKHRSERG